MATWSSILIGLTRVGFRTSTPELVTLVTAATRKHADVAYLISIA
jgi:Ca2+/Na+ antiporter